MTSERRVLEILLGALWALGACDAPTSLPTPELAILTADLAPGVVGQLYNAGIDAEGGGGGYHWDIRRGELPPGMDLLVEDLSDDDALLTGVPETVGIYSFVLRVATEEGAEADSVSLELEILPAANELQIENLALPPTVVGLAVAIPLRVTGGGPEEPVWAVAAGSLPGGLHLEPGGRISGAAAATGASRIVLQASRGGESTFKVFIMRVLPDDVSGFGITLFPLAEVSEELRPHLDDAAERWELVILGDLEGGIVPEQFFGEGQCGGFGEEANGTAVDDLLVLVNIDSIDGPGRVLGQAGPCGIRGDLLPFVGVLTLDESDLLPLVGSTTLTSLITHELGHVLGFGTLWTRATLLEGRDTDDPRFTGEGAVAQWNALGGEGAVPVENEGGEGTANSHLRESVFDRELMTGFAERLGAPQPMSAVTISAMGDLGYTVDWSAADSYALASAPLGAEAATSLGWDLAGAGTVHVLPTFGAASARSPSR
jgi:hypothetical protein